MPTSEPQHLPTPSLNRPDAADLCAVEPIHNPGKVQPHGALLVLEPETHALLQVSTNASALLAAEMSAGKPWPTNSRMVDALLQSLRDTRGDDVTDAARTIVVGDHMLHLQLHQGAQGLIVEIEPSSRAEADSFDALYPSIRSFVDRIEATAEIAALCEITAIEVRRLTGFDRVLVYRFARDWQGTVVAEDGNGTLPSYLGLRFPASDIPAQARALYRRTRLRLIPDADGAPAAVLPALSPLDGLPLDLSSAALRAVAPVHLEYMRNMGTAASMSMSILVDGELWGLISCHHARPRVLGPQLRSSCDFIGQLLAMQIGGRERSALADERLALRDVESELLARVSRAASVRAGLGESTDAWLRLAGATGAAFVQDGAVLTAGKAPGHEAITKLTDWLRRTRPGEVYSTHELGRHHAPALSYADSACGLLAVPISALHADYIVWFRPELVHTVKWSGEPAKVAGDDGRLHPRRSFAQWTEEVRGRAEPWRRAEIDATLSFRNAVVTFVLKRAEERAMLTEKLVTTNQELEAFSYSVSHDLRAPFRHVVGYAQLLREESGMLDPRPRHYLDSIIESALSAGQLVDDLLNFSQLGRAAIELHRVDMDKLVSEVRRSMELDAGERQVEWRVQAMPPAYADASLLRQAVSNLIDNALKYTRDRTPAVIEVSGEDRAHETVYTVRDNGVGFDMAYVGKLFGVFQRLHRVEEFEGTGIGLALVRRIIDRHGGWIAAEGRLNEGAVFRIGLPKPAKEVGHD